VVGGSSGRRGLRSFEAELFETEFIDEDVNLNTQGLEVWLDRKKS